MYHLLFLSIFLITSFIHSSPRLLDEDDDNDLLQHQTSSFTNKIKSTTSSSNNNNNNYLENGIFIPHREDTTEIDPYIAHQEEEPTSTTNNESTTTNNNRITIIDSNHNLENKKPPPPLPLPTKRIEDIESPDVLVLNELRRMWWENPVITIYNEEDFERYTGTSSHLRFDTRPYWLAIIFKSSSLGCNLTDAEFFATAKRYWKSLEQRRGVSTAKLFFLRVQFNLVPGIFRKHKINKVPSLVLIPPNNTFTREFDPDWFRSPNDSLNQLGNWVSTTSGITFTTSDGNSLTSSFQAESLSDTFRWILIAQVVMLFAFNAWRLRYRKTWMLISIGIYCLSISGTLFCFLRGAPPFGMTQAHGLLFIYPDRGGQFWFEGLWIACLNVSISMGLLAAVEFYQGHDVIESTIEAIEEWEASGAVDDNGNPLPPPPVRNNNNNPQRLSREEAKKRNDRLCKNALMCLAMAMFSYSMITAVYKRKGGW
jgi:hypothetical protein